MATPQAMRRFPILAVLIAPLLFALTACGPEGRGASPDAGATLRLLSYRVTDASPELVDRYDAADDDAGALAVFEAVEPDLDLSVELEPGEVGTVAEGRVTGTVAYEPADGDRVELMLNLERFFDGTPLLIPACEPYVVARFKARAQGRTQLTLRAVQVDTGACTGVDGQG